MRYRSGIEYDTRLQYDGKTLQIVGRENVNERDREWRLECEVVEQ
jgi:head-tail adaptor